MVGLVQVTLRSVLAPMPKPEDGSHEYPDPNQLIATLTYEGQHLLSSWFSARRIPAMCGIENVLQLEFIVVYLSHRHSLYALANQLLPFKLQLPPALTLNNYLPPEAFCAPIRM